jgi:hypothetical protein
MNALTEKPVIIQKARIEPGNGTGHAVVWGVPARWIFQGVKMESEEPENELHADLINKAVEGMVYSAPTTPEEQKNGPQF